MASDVKNTCGISVYSNEYTFKIFLFDSEYLFSQSTVLPFKITVSQTVKKHTAFYGKRSLNATFTTASHRFLSGSRWILFKFTHPIFYIHFNITFHLSLGLVSGLFPSGFLTKTLRPFLIQYLVASLNFCFLRSLFFFNLLSLARVPLPHETSLINASILYSFKYSVQSWTLLCWSLHIIQLASFVVLTEMLMCLSVPVLKLSIHVKYSCNKTACTIKI